MKKHSLFRSFGYALRGIKFTLKNERNFQIELFAFLLNVLLIFWLPLKSWEIVAILGACFLVLVAELINTAIEKLCDFVQPTYHIKIKMVKDISAGAVLITAFMALILGIIIYFPHLKSWIF